MMLMGDLPSFLCGVTILAYCFGAFAYGQPGNREDISSLQTLDLMERIKASSGDEVEEFEKFNKVLKNVFDNGGEGEHQWLDTLTDNKSKDVSVAKKIVLNQPTDTVSDNNDIDNKSHIKVEVTTETPDLGLNGTTTTHAFFSEQTTAASTTLGASTTLVNLLLTMLNSLKSNYYMRTTKVERILFKDLLQKITENEGKFLTENLRLIRVARNESNLNTTESFNKLVTNLQEVSFVESLISILKFVVNSTKDSTNAEFDQLKELLKSRPTGGFISEEKFRSMIDGLNFFNLTNYFKVLNNNETGNKSHIRVEVAQTPEIHGATTNALFSEQKSVASTTLGASATLVDLLLIMLNSLKSNHSMRATKVERILFKDLLQKITENEGRFLTENLELIKDIIQTVLSLSYGVARNESNLNSTRNFYKPVTNSQNVSFVKSLISILKCVVSSTKYSTNAEFDQLKELLKSTGGLIPEEKFRSIIDGLKFFNLTNFFKALNVTNQTSISKAVTKVSANYSQRASFAKSLISILKFVGNTSKNSTNNTFEQLKELLGKVTDDLISEDKFQSIIEGLNIFNVTHVTNRTSFLEAVTERYANYLIETTTQDFITPSNINLTAVETFSNVVTEGANTLEGTTNIITQPITNVVNLATTDEFINTEPTFSKVVAESANILKETTNDFTQPITNVVNELNTNFVNQYVTEEFSDTNNQSPFSEGVNDLSELMRTTSKDQLHSNLFNISAVEDLLTIFKSINQLNKNAIIEGENKLMGPSTDITQSNTKVVNLTAVKEVITSNTEPTFSKAVTDGGNTLKGVANVITQPITNFDNLVADEEVISTEPTFPNPVTGGANTVKEVIKVTTQPITNVVNLAADEEIIIADPTFSKVVTEGAKTLKGATNVITQPNTNVVNLSVTEVITEPTFSKVVTEGGNTLKEVTNVFTQIITNVVNLAADEEIITTEPTFSKAVTEGANTLKGVTNVISQPITNVVNLAADEEVISTEPTFPNAVTEGANTSKGVTNLISQPITNVVNLSVTEVTTEPTFSKAVTEGTNTLKGVTNVFTQLNTNVVNLAADEEVINTEPTFSKAVTEGASTKGTTNVSSKESITPLHSNFFNASVVKGLLKILKSIDRQNNNPKAMELERLETLLLNEEIFWSKEEFSSLITNLTALLKVFDHPVAISGSLKHHSGITETTTIKSGTNNRINVTPSPSWLPSFLPLHTGNLFTKESTTVGNLPWVEEWYKNGERGNPKANISPENAWSSSHHVSESVTNSQMDIHQTIPHVVETSSRSTVYPASDTFKMNDIFGPSTKPLFTTTSKTTEQGIGDLITVKRDGSTKNIENLHTGSLATKTDPGFEWSEWSNWQQCSASCGFGVKVATRDCKLHIESLDIKSKLCKGNATKVIRCILSQCDHILLNSSSVLHINSSSMILNTTNSTSNQSAVIEIRETRIVEAIIMAVVMFIVILIVFVTIRIRSLMRVDSNSDIELSRIVKLTGKSKSLLKKHGIWLKDFGEYIKRKKKKHSKANNINIDQFLKELDEIASDDDSD